jgi:hypothetical protein
MHGYHSLRGLSLNRVAASAEGYLRKASASCTCFKLLILFAMMTSNAGYGLQSVFFNS